jgi:cell division septum initiation protein DivIVA|tara:strand:+ start:1442 stop:1693 length:252 start_codon:yes stop_codon:yes gene_type:complete
MTIIQENKELKNKIKELETEIKGLKCNNKDDEKKTKKKRQPTGYQLFVKEKFAYFKKEDSSKSAPEIMKLIAQEWKKTKSDDS